MVHELSKHHSIFNQFLAELRDVEIQKDPMRFRQNLQRIGQIMALEVSKVLTYKPIEVVTPLGIAEISLLEEQPVLCSILRAGLPMHQGFLDYFDRAENAFATAYRRHHKGGDFEIEVEYVSSPVLTDRELIIIDPMLATGASIELVYKSLLAKGIPKRTHICAAVATDTGLNHLRSKLPEGTTYWTGAVDKELTAQAYIVPGLGDAGDLAYGRKG
jgi:uracil phosphoribosyltransferase